MIYLSFVSSYIIPVAVFVGIATLLGFGLAFLGEVLNVKKDVRIDEIRGLLCGANCGVCGYPGCDAFAVALLAGDAKLEACKPTSNENKEQISKILGVSIEKGEKKVAVVHCAGGKHCFDKGGYLGYGDCKSANMLSGGTKACEVGCMGLGSCVDECAFNAIRIDKNNDYAVIDAHDCVACGACLNECPKNLIAFIPANAKVYIGCSNHNKGKDVSTYCSVGCIACGICERVCEYKAIRMKNNLPEIDYQRCTGCGVCAKRCPKHTIIER